MGQFGICANTDNETKNEYPFLLDVQSPLLEDIDTRMVIPLVLMSNRKYKAITKLTPIIEVKGKEYIALTPQLAGIPKRLLGPEIANISSIRFDIIAAIDLLITGF